MDWSSWGTSWFGRWGDSWGPIQVEDVRRPKSTNTLKLVKFKEGKSYLEHSRSLTRSKRVEAKGVRVIPDAPLSIPGHITASHSRSGSRCGVLKSRAGAKSGGIHASSASLTHTLHSRASAGSALRTSRNYALYGEIWVSAGASATTLQSSTKTNFEPVSARGQINVTTEALIGVAVLYSRR